MHVVCVRNLGQILCMLFIFLFIAFIHCEESSEEFISTGELETEEDEIDIVYITPKASSSSYLFETFDDVAAYEKKWIKSKAKKDDVDEIIAKYDGIWSVEPLEKDALLGDNGLVLKSKAKHAAISVPLSKTFVLKDKPFVVQYEVNLQNGQECGGAYIKLLSQGKDRLDLKNFNDKTPYTIMFGPDKCGNDFKLHFIFRHVNPLTKEIEEKHCKKPEQKVEEPFRDKKPHLYTLILRPDNTYSVLVDHEVVNSGNLLEDFTPPVNPPKEIDDPSDKKPTDWDEREKIPNPTASKPEDWDEDEPRQIVDEFATKPDGWLDDEPELIPDPEAVKPDDWDEEMDGEWEAALIPNPKCEESPGCGEWKAPVIDNPKYKGKWKAPLVDNPNYKGKWAPRRIHNPGYFEDLEPFKMTSIGAVGLELWSMSDGIYFDNVLVTDSVEDARRLAAETFDLKVFKVQKGEKGVFSQMIDFSNKHPWIYGVYVLALAIPVVLIFVCCCGEDVKQESEDEAALKKKTDEPTADDEVKEEPTKNEEQEEQEEEEDNDEEQEEEEEERAEGQEDRESDVEQSDDDVRKSPRLRKLRKE